MLHLSWVTKCLWVTRWSKTRRESSVPASGGPRGPQNLTGVTVRVASPSDVPNGIAPPCTVAIAHEGGGTRGRQACSVFVPPCQSSHSVVSRLSTSQKVFLLVGTLCAVQWQSCADFFGKGRFSGSRKSTDTVGLRRRLYFDDRSSFLKTTKSQGIPHKTCASEPERSLTNGISTKTGHPYRPPALFSPPNFLRYARLQRGLEELRLRIGVCHKLSYRLLD
jgi:hypothetical protein